MDGLQQALRVAGWVVYSGATVTGPSLFACHAQKGLLAIAIGDSADPQLMVQLNRAVQHLRDRIPEISRVKIVRRLVDPAADTSRGSVLALSDAMSPDWVAKLKDEPLNDEIVESIKTALTGPTVIDLPRRLVPRDIHQEERAETRVELDAAQSAIACQDVDDILVLSGPPGSGKTLVLAARARWLAQRHPEWDIQLLCFNRLLVPYLTSLTADLPSVKVDTFGKFAHRQGFHVSLDDEMQAARDVNRQMHRVRPVMDALLVDEWQDFMPAWTRLVVAMVHSHRGGIVLAGDPLQALYRDSTMTAELTDRQVLQVALERPYRSTRQILDVASILDIGMEVPNRALALEGEPVDLVWAENIGGQIDAVVRDVQLILHENERQPSDIGVLVTRRWHVGRLLGALNAAGIPCSLARAKEAAEFRLDEPTVKVMTAHSAKGYEFGVTFLVGLEDLPNPDVSSDHARQGRCGYVGITRARDHLILTYSKDNIYLQRVRSIPDEVLRRWIWPDDYPED